MGNRQPVFRIRNFRIAHFKYLKEKHVSGLLSQFIQSNQ